MSKSCCPNCVTQILVKTEESVWMETASGTKPVSVTLDTREIIAKLVKFSTTL